MKTHQAKYSMVGWTSKSIKTREEDIEVRARVPVLLWNSHFKNSNCACINVNKQYKEGNKNLLDALC